MIVFLLKYRSILVRHRLKFTKSSNKYKIFISHKCSWHERPLIIPFIPLLVSISSPLFLFLELHKYLFWEIHTYHSSEKQFSWQWRVNIYFYEYHILVILGSFHLGNIILLKRMFYEWKQYCTTSDLFS